MSGECDRCGEHAVDCRCAAMADEKTTVDEISTFLSGLGWIRIKWDTPVAKEHADSALLAAIAPDPELSALRERVKELEGAMADGKLKVYPNEPLREPVNEYRNTVAEILVEAYSRTPDPELSALREENRRLHAVKEDHFRNAERLAGEVAKRDTKLSALRERVKELEGVLEKVRDDLMMRAEKDDDGTPIVAVGVSVWLKLNATLSKGETKNESD